MRPDYFAGDVPMKNLSNFKIFIVAIATLGFVGKSGATTQDHVKQVFYNVTWVLTQIGSSPVTKISLNSLSIQRRSWSLVQPELTACTRTLL